MSDKFKIEDSVIVCESDSGSRYELTEESCTCKGFGFRRTCRHINDAKEQGLFKKIKEKMRTQPSLSVSFNFNRKMREMRLKALIVFLKNCKIMPTRGMLKEIEPKLNINTTPEQVVEWAEKFKGE